MLKVLCLLDAQHATEQIKTELSSKYQLEFTADAEEALSALQASAYDVFIFSAFLKAQSVVSVLLRLKHMNLVGDTRIVCIRDQMTPVAIASDKLLKHTVTALGANDYMSLDKLLRNHRQLLSVPDDR